MIARSDPSKTSCPRTAPGLPDLGFSLGSWPTDKYLEGQTLSIRRVRPHDSSRQNQSYYRAVRFGIRESRRDPRTARFMTVQRVTCMRRSQPEAELPAQNLCATPGPSGRVDEVFPTWLVPTRLSFFHCEWLTWRLQPGSTGTRLPRIVSTSLFTARRNMEAIRIIDVQNPIGLCPIPRFIYCETRD